MVYIEKIEDTGEVLAIIVRGNDYEEGVSFLTTDEMPIQLGLHNQKKGKIIAAHKHIPIKSIENLRISEFFYMKKGRVKVSLYNKEDRKVKEVIVNSGDLIYLLGGHGFEFLEDTLMFELKQGPYRSREEEKEMIR